MGRMDTSPICISSVLKNPLSLQDSHFLDMPDVTQGLLFHIGNIQSVGQGSESIAVEGLQSTHTGEIQEFSIA